MEFKIEDIRKLIFEEKIQWINHMLIRMRQRGIKINDVLYCLMN